MVTYLISFIFVTADVLLGSKSDVIFQVLAYVKRCKQRKSDLNGYLLNNLYLMKPMEEKQVSNESPKAPCEQFRQLHRLLSPRLSFIWRNSSHRDMSSLMLSFDPAPLTSPFTALFSLSSLSRLIEGWIWLYTTHREQTSSVRASQ